MTPHTKSILRASRKVNTAVRSGRLVKSPCAVCGNPEVQGHHHNGYDPDHELDVVWLCRAHHLEAHHRRQKPSWRRPPGLRAYMATTRPRGRPERLWGFGPQSSPVRLLWVIRKAWELLLTDEERDHAAALFDQLIQSHRKAQGEKP